MTKKLNTRLHLMYLIALVPLIAFGLYKNGIELYQKSLLGPVNMLKPLILLFMAISGAIIGGIVRESRVSKKIDREILYKCSDDIIEAMLTASILPVATSPFILSIVIFVFSAFLNKIKFNKICTQYLIIQVINIALGLDSFSNAYIDTRVLNYDGLDLFWGLGSGGVFSTSILFMIIALVFLSFNKLYKRDIVYSGILSFLVLGIVPNMIMGHFDSIFPLIFGYNILFAIIFIAPNVTTSCYTVKGQIASGILIGILTYILSFFTPYMAVIIAILISSILNKVIDRVFVIK